MMNDVKLSVECCAKHRLVNDHRSGQEQQCQKRKLRFVSVDCIK